jgi:hypothetical protein
MVVKHEIFTTLVITKIKLSSSVIVLGGVGIEMNPFIVSE